MPLVIFDGPEAAGKSTLIDALMEEWGPNSRLRSWGPRESWLEYCQPLFDDLKACQEDPFLLVCWSRSWLSRSVYNKMLAQGQNVPPRTMTELDNIVVRSGGLLILMTAPVDILLERRLTRMNEGNAKPDHPLDPRKEQGEFQLQSRPRKWRTLSGTTEPETNVRTIMTLLVQRNPECRMGPRKEVTDEVGLVAAS